MIHLNKLTCKIQNKKLKPKMHKDKNHIGRYKQLSYTSILQQIKYNAICGNNRITPNLHKSGMGIRYSNEIKKILILQIKFVRIRF